MEKIGTSELIIIFMILFAFIAMAVLAVVLIKKMFKKK